MWECGFCVRCETSERKKLGGNICCFVLLFRGRRRVQVRSLLRSKLLAGDSVGSQVLGDGGGFPGVYQEVDLVQGVLAGRGSRVLAVDGVQVAVEMVVVVVGVVWGAWGGFW